MTESGDTEPKPKEAELAPSKSVESVEIETAEPERFDAYAPLRYRNFRLYVAERFTFIVGVIMMEVIVQWQVYDLTHDKLALGLIGLAEAIPKISISLYAGHVVDRNSRKRIAASAMSVVFFSTLLLIGISLNATAVYHSFGVLPFYFTTALSGIGYGFSNPANFALMGELIPRKLYPRASAWNSSTWQSAAILGPASAGFLYWLTGATNTYIISASLMLAALSALFFIPSKPVKAPEVVVSVRESLKAGIKFVFQSEIILSALSLDLFAVLFGGATALLPVYANDILRVGAEGLGILRAAPSVGAVITALFLAHREMKGNVGRHLLFAVTGFGITMILFAISTNFLLSLFVLVVSGAFDSISVVIRSTILQVKTPNEMRGRVASVNAMFIGSSNEIGAFESGVAAKIMNTVPSVIFGGCMTIITVLAVGFFSPKLRKLKNLV